MAGARGRHPLRRSAAARLTRPVLPNGGCGGVGCPRSAPAQRERHGPHNGHVPFVARPSPVGAVRHALLEALAVLVPVTCAGCGGPDRSVCAPCIAALRPVPRLVARDGVAAWAALEYSGAVARVIGAYKDGARTDAAGPLADAELDAPGLVVVAVAQHEAVVGAGDRVQNFRRHASGVVACEVHEDEGHFS